MTRVEAIEEQIQSLSQAELEELREWILDKDWQAWDKQIEEDAASGKLDKIFEEARRQSLLVSRRRSETMVTRKNMVTIPTEVRRKLGIKPGWRLDWQPVEGKEEILVRVIPDRGELARRLLGAGREFSPDRDAVAELVAEREGAG